MNIGHVTSRYIPAPLRGPERYIQIISEKLVEKGHKVTVLVSDVYVPEGYLNPLKRRVNKRSDVINNVQVKRFRNAYEVKLAFNSFELIATSLGFKNNILSILARGPFSPELYFHLVRTKYDIIHATSFPYAYVLLAWMAARRTRTPFIITPFFLSIKYPLNKNRYLLSILTHSDGIIVPTSMEKRMLTELGVNPKKIHIIPMPVEIEKFRCANGERFRRKYGLGSSPIILFVGPKEYDKGAIHTLRAVSLVQKVVKDVALVACGPYTKAWLKEKKKLKGINLIDLPWINGRDKLEAFNACDVFVMPSRVEALGIVYLEAWASKKPVIGARVDPMPEIIKDGINGFLVDFGNVGELAEKILSLIRNSILRQEMGMNGWNSVQISNPKNVCDKIETIYQSVLKAC